MPKDNKWTHIGFGFLLFTTLGFTAGTIFGFGAAAVIQLIGGWTLTGAQPHTFPMATAGAFALGGGLIGIGLGALYCYDILNEEDKK